MLKERLKGPFKLTFSYSSLVSSAVMHDECFLSVMCSIAVSFVYLFSRGLSAANYFVAMGKKTGHWSAEQDACVTSDRLCTASE